MKSFIAIALSFVVIAMLILGCAAKAPAGANTSSPVSPLPAAIGQQAAATTEPPPNTSNLSFSRNASDVMNTETKPFTPPTFDFTNTTTSDGRLIVNYFFSAHCSACKALRPVIDALEANHTEVEWREFDITTQNGTWAYQQFANEKGLNQSQRLVPQVLVNGTIITDRFNINKSLDGIIIAFSASQS